MEKKDTTSREVNKKKESNYKGQNESNHKRQRYTI